MSVPAYSEYKDANIHWIDRVPSHWELKKIAWHLPYETGWTPPTDRSELYDGDQPWVTIADMDVTEITDTKTKITQQAVDERGGRIVPAGSFLFSFKLTVGQTAFLGIPAYINEAIAAFEPNRDIDLKFWSYAASRVIPRYARENIYGATILNQDLIGSARFYVPPKSEQRQIADFLDYETARIDALIEEKKRLVELLVEERDARITHAVTRGLDVSTSTRDSGLHWLGEIPAHWEVRKISTVTDKVTNGYVGPTRDVLKNSGVCYLQSLHIKRNQINFDPPYYVEEQWSQNHSKSILREGDVLVVQTGDIGQVAYVPGEFAGSNCHALIILSPITNVLDGRFLSWVLDSSYGFNSLKSVQTGALHPHLNCGYVRDIYIPVPPIQEQAEIARYIDATEREFDSLVGQIRSGESLLKERRSAVIAAAVTGKIDVQEWRQSTPSTEAILPEMAEKETPYG